MQIQASTPISDPHGGTLPTADDDVRSNSFTVTVDGDYTVLTVSNRAIY